jgi:branched-chain amino acid transport system ATP-binding protein
MLRLDGVSTSYGRIRAISGVSLHVKPGEIVTLLGANGAGKSTTLMTISGILHPNAGRIFFENHDITAASADSIVSRGLVHVPEGRRILAQLTVEENLDLAGHRLSALLRRERKDEVYSTFPHLHERRRQLGGTLSGGEQQMLAIGRALVVKPRLLMLDEPSLGLAPKIVEQVFDTIVALNHAGTTILLVEQNAALALDIAHRGYVLEIGSVVLDGDAASLATNQAVMKAYLSA